MIHLNGGDQIQKMNKLTALNKSENVSLKHANTKTQKKTLESLLRGKIWHHAHFTTGLPRDYSVHSFKLNFGVREETWCTLEDMNVKESQKIGKYKSDNQLKAALQ
jgi:hypothetical protein